MSHRIQKFLRKWLIIDLRRRNKYSHLKVAFFELEFVVWIAVGYLAYSIQSFYGKVLLVAQWLLLSLPVYIAILWLNEKAKEQTK